MPAFYEEVPRESPVSLLRQGDIVERVPFPVFSPNEATILVPGEKETTTVDLTAAPLPVGAYLVTSVEHRPGIVLTQTCDLVDTGGRQNQPIVFGKICDWKTRLKSPDKLDTPKGRVDRIKELSRPRLHPRAFYLQPLESETADFSLGRSLAMLLETAHFPPQAAAQFKSHVRLRLSPAALASFQERLRVCFGRYAADEKLFFCPQDEEEG